MGVATVFGGSGFIGRYVVRRLAGEGHLVRVAVRDTEAALFLKPMGAVGQVVPLHAPATDAGAVARAVAGADFVVNLVGILAESRPGDFARAHVDAARAIAEAARTAGARRLVHVSALGCDAGHPALYARTKAEGEAAVRAAFPAATILRPSVVFGPEDRFFNLFATIAQRSPVMPVFAGATRYQPVFVGDVAAAVTAALHRPDAPGRIYELGGPAVMTMREAVAFVLAETRRDRCVWAVPSAIAGLQAAVMERLPGRMLTRDQLKLMARDNVVSAGVPDLAALGITPTPVAAVVPAYLRRYRPAGRAAE
jgi:NADH dehydrogenase